jgi:hypothetical protein
MVALKRSRYIISLLSFVLFSCPAFGGVPEQIDAAQYIYCSVRAKDGRKT